MSVTSQRFARTIRRFEQSPEAVADRAESAQIGEGATREDLFALKAWLDGQRLDATASRKALVAFKMAGALLVRVPTTEFPTTLGSVLRYVRSAGLTPPARFAPFMARLPAERAPSR